MLHRRWRILGREEKREIEISQPTHKREREVLEMRVDLRVSESLFDYLPQLERTYSHGRGTVISEGFPNRIFHTTDDRYHLEGVPISYLQYHLKGDSYRTPLRSTTRRSLTSSPPEPRRSSPTHERPTPIINCTLCTLDDAVERPRGGGAEGATVLPLPPSPPGIPHLFPNPLRCIVRASGLRGCQTVRSPSIPRAAPAALRHDLSILA